MFPHPLTRRAFTLGLALSVVTAADARQRELPHADRRESAEARAFAKFVESIWPAAEKQGVSRETFDAAFHGVTYDPAIVAQTEGQAEFAKPVWDYLAGAVSAERIQQGRGKYQEQKQWLDKAERDYGVSAATIMGIWGIESGFGAFQGSDYVIRALASLSLSDYQPEYFRSELVAALKILQCGDIEPKKMLGSWAGAMGQTQFMPSSYLKYAVDFDGRGRRDIWNDSADAIGSTGHYLAEHGWRRGLPWGFEVRLPDNFALTAADCTDAAPFADFARRGVGRAHGEALPVEGEGRLMILAGLRGPIFLVTPNFPVIKTYNNSTSYALAVSLLGDAILESRALQAEWPRRDRQLAPAEVKELQTRLMKMGYDVGDIDGRVGDGLRSAVRKYQEAIGQRPDGYATPELLKRMLRRPREAG